MILITGSTGFIGRVLGRSLDHAGHEWRPYSGRMNAPETLHAELEGVDVIIHLAGAEARGSNRLLQKVDVEGTELLLELARQAGVGRIIMPSRINADPHSMHPLLRAKGEMERTVRQCGIPYNILRTTTLFGRDDRYSEIVLSLALWSWPLAWLPGGGVSPVQPLWVEDYVQCIVQLLDQPERANRVMTVAGNELLTYREFVRAILDVTRKPRLLMPLPMGLARPINHLALTWWYWPPMSRFFFDRFFAPEVTSLDAVQRLFGFHPARFKETITYLNRPGMRRRLFRH